MLDGFLGAFFYKQGYLRIVACQFPSMATCSVDGGDHLEGKVDCEDGLFLSVTERCDGDGGWRTRVKTMAQSSRPHVFNMMLRT